jgi:hypothetical protein
VNGVTTDGEISDVSLELPPWNYPPLGVRGRRGGRPVWGFPKSKVRKSLDSTVAYAAFKHLPLPQRELTGSLDVGNWLLCGTDTFC